VRIDHLIVDNFNGFDHREFAFNPSFNLLVGDNASGKSSVLDALSVALGSWFLGIRGYANAHGIDALESMGLKLTPRNSPQGVGKGAANPKLKVKLSTSSSNRSSEFVSQPGT
jgi:AAA15 family ATPase/GTPase